MKLYPKAGKPAIALVLICIIITCVATGCGNVATTSDSAQDASKPFHLSMMTWFESAEPPKEDNVLVHELEKRTNTKLDITWVGLNYSEKLNVTIASDQLPMVTLVIDTKSPVIINAVRSNLFWDLTPYLQDYSNLSHLDGKLLYNSSIDGKTYGIYRPRYTARYGLFYRQDWLEKLGLKEPTTMDELYEMLKAFTTGDPDGNGKQDTYGFATSTTGAGSGLFNGVYPFEIMRGAPNGWGLIDGKMVPSFMTQEYLDNLKFLRRLYDEKIINQDFASSPNTKPEDEFVKGRVGIRSSALENFTLPYLNTDLLQANPNAKVGVITRIQGQKGIRVQAGSGINGMYMISKNAVKTEADLKRVLAFLNELNSDEMITMFNYGIEGSHYTVRDGMKTIDPTRANKEVYPVRHLGMSLPVTNNGTPLAKTVEQMLKDNVPYGVADPTTPLISNTFTERGKTVTKIIDDARVKFIMGDIDEKGWQAAKEEWKQQGGDRIMEEFTVEYYKYHHK
ncbi:extracellular solute-binding protein [Bacillus sp. 3255]|uniref:extracellular solute-binding protein n=1 Tax=Bacillus sp. 3255 TaxID=2817904 RepID=UPI002859B72B|nr:extracellular solute-binding protein [Bacillus sp. 3255]MDR6880855.1 putative aldouronate transport system substrate-binding protein [Bacillus sp. 3255]